MTYTKGEKVNYQGTENGIVLREQETDKVARIKIVFVVYKCDEDWENFENYTAQATFRGDLKKGWI